MKKKLKVKRLDEELINQQERHSIDSLNWKDFLYKPEVAFQITHSGDAITLKFKVNEKYILASETRTNSEVYKDSCVEFFISFDGQNYYNFEFSCIGTIHLAYGPGRGKRKFVDSELISSVEIHSSLGNQPFEERKGNFEWVLKAMIPVSCFAFDRISNLSGMEARANFYNCGDGTSEPHYISWNPVNTEEPDYHRPEFFGTLVFE